jgi:hypothetical protein
MTASLCLLLPPFLFMLYLLTNVLLLRKAKFTQEAQACRIQLTGRFANGHQENRYLINGTTTSIIK